MKTINFRQDAFTSLIKLANLLTAPVAALLAALLVLWLGVLPLIINGIIAFAVKSGLVNLIMVDASFLEKLIISITMLQEYLGHNFFLILLFLVGTAIVLIPFAWTINALLLIAKAKLRGEEMLVNYVLRNSIGKSFFRTFYLLGLFFAGFCIYLLLLFALLRIPPVGAWVFDLNESNTALLMLIVALILSVFGVAMHRFIGAFGAITHGKLKLWDAMLFSWKHSSWLKSGLLYVVFLLSMVSYVLLSNAMSGIWKLLNLEVGNYLNTVIESVFRLPIDIIFFTLLSAGLTVLFHRYGKDKKVDVEAHLMGSKNTEIQ